MYQTMYFSFPLIINHPFPISLDEIDTHHVLNIEDNFIVACHPFVTSCFVDSADKTTHYRDKVKYSTYSGDHDGMEIVRMDIYNQRCMEYIANNQYLVDWKVFPPIYLDFKHDLTKEIAMEFQECLSSTGSTGVILCGYNSLSYSDFLLHGCFTRELLFAHALVF